MDARDISDTTFERLTGDGRSNEHAETETTHHHGELSEVDVNGSFQSSSVSLELRRCDFQSIKIFLTTYFSTSHGVEFVTCFASGLLMIFVGYFTRKPRQRPVPYQYLEDAGSYILNLSNNEAYVTSTVPTWQLAILCILVCPLGQIIISWKYGLQGDLHRTLCVYIVALPLTALITNSLKIYVGYLRPNFYDQCVPSYNYQYCTMDESTNGWDARKSFPSGHASYTFCALTLLSLFLERIFGISSIQEARLVMQTDATSPDNRESTHRIIFRFKESPMRYRCYSMLCVTPLALALFVAASRVVDNKHFPADVIAGSFLGWSIATYFHHMW